MKSRKISAMLMSVITLMGIASLAYADEEMTAETEVSEIYEMSEMSEETVQSDETVPDDILQIEIAAQMDAMAEAAAMAEVEAAEEAYAVVENEAVTETDTVDETEDITETEVTVSLESVIESEDITESEPDMTEETVSIDAYDFSEAEYFDNPCVMYLATDYEVRTAGDPNAEVIAWLPASSEVQVLQMSWDSPWVIVSVNDGVGFVNMFDLVSEPVVNYGVADDATAEEWFAEAIGYEE